MELKKEIKEIHNLIILKNETLYKSLKKRKDFNIEGSLTNVILCDLENLVITTAYHYLITNGFEVCVLVFDGLMIKKNDIHIPFPAETLKDMSNYILNKTGYDVKFIEKQLDDSIDLNIIRNKINDTRMINLANKNIINDTVRCYIKNFLIIKVMGQG